MRALTQLLIPVLALTFLWGAELPAQNATIVVLRGGRTEEVTDHRVTQDSYKGVVAKKGVATRSWKIDEILEIRYEGPPELYKKGIAAYKAGDYEAAASDLKQLLDDGPSDDWVIIYGHYYYGQALRRLGYVNDALAAFEALLVKDPESRFVPDVRLAIADLAMLRGAGGAGEARKQLQLLETLAKNGELPKRYAFLAQLGAASLEARFGDADKGLKQLETLLAEATGEKVVANMIRLEIGQVFIRKREFQRASQYYEQILANVDMSNPNLEILAGASNGLGDCEFEQGQYQKALKTYSRVYSLFLDRADLREKVAHALFYGGKSYELQSGREEGDQKKVYEKRGRYLMKKAAREFQGTAGGEAAKREIGR